jgi:O-antigen/teichoic acid export membrane protein
VSEPGESRLDLRRLVAAAGLYAGAALAQRGVGLLLLPLYTRALPPAEYGMLELFNTFTAVIGTVLALGFASAINKVLHADCETPAERQALLSTALLVDLPVVLLGAALLVLGARPLAGWLVGDVAAADCVWLIAGQVVAATIWSLAVAMLRAQERALAFGVLNLAQFVLTAGLNVVFVAVLGWGVRGVLLGTLLAQLLALPVALLVAGRGSRLTIAPRLVRPLLQFGVLLLPMMLAGWVMDVSDRWVLRAYRDLDEVAVYAVGYKLGALLDTAVVWPFQLAWPAFAFAASRRAGHRDTYARTFTYLVAVLSFAALAAALLAPSVLPWLAGPTYRDAARVVPWVALAYAANGAQFFFSPAVQLGGRVRSLAWYAPCAAVVNLGLSLLLVPRFGMMGAAASTLIAFAVLTVLVARTAQRVYPVPLESGRLAVVIGAALGSYALWWLLAPAGGAGMVLAALAALLVFPTAVVAAGVLRADEREALRALLRRRRVAAEGALLR